MRILAFALTLFVCGCAHPYLKSWTENDFTVCCKGLACKPEKLDEFAQDRCPAAKNVGGYNDEVSTGSSMHYNGLTGRVVSEDHMVNVSCLKYSCDRKPASH
jgi:hypothetical protein